MNKSERSLPARSSSGSGARRAAWRDGAGVVLIVMGLIAFGLVACAWSFALLLHMFTMPAITPGWLAGFAAPPLLVGLGVGCIAWGRRPPGVRRRHNGSCVCCGYVIDRLVPDAGCPACGHGR